MPCYRTRFACFPALGGYWKRAAAKMLPRPPVSNTRIVNPSEGDGDFDWFGGIGRDRDGVAVEGAAVDGDRALAGAVHGDVVGGPRYTRVTVRWVNRAGRWGSIARPSRVGRTPSGYWDASTKVHAAVPVSQEFLPSPGVGDSSSKKPSNTPLPIQSPPRRWTGCAGSWTSRPRHSTGTIPRSRSRR